MAQYTGNFETGVNGNNILTADPGSANAWNDRYDGFGDVTVKYASPSAYGALSAEIVIAATPNYGWVAWDSSTLGSLTELWGRVYLRLSSLPGAKGYFVKGSITAGDALAWGITISTDGLIRLVDKDGNNIAIGAVPVNVGAWFRIEFHVINSATVGQIEAKLFNNADSNNATETITSAASFNLQTTTQKIRFGQSENAFANCTINMDNILVNDTGYPGPLPSQVTANFERGVNGATILAADSGSATAFDAVGISPNGTAVYSNTHAYGVKAGRFGSTGAGGYGYVAWSTAVGTLTDHYGRIYLYLAANPISQMPLIMASQGSTRGARIDVNSSGQLAGFDNPAAALFTTMTTAIALNQWVRIEYHIVHSTTVGQAEVKLFNDPRSTTPTETQTGTANKNTLANADTLKFGAGSEEGSVAAGESIWIDNIVAGAPAYPGPVAEASVQQLDVHHVRGLW